jgi:hypothetical protein
MKKRSSKIIATLLLFIPFFVAITPHLAFADWFSISANVVYWLTAAITGLWLAVSGALVTITGSLLNASLTATLHMSDIVNSTPAVGSVWTTIRNFASIFIIFMLLEASIKIILGLGSDTGKLIKNIVIAGLLINFSLFFTKLAVDASNIISLSFYTAIAPTALGQTGSTVNPSSSGAGALTGLVADAFDDGGLSNVFMQSLDLQGVASNPAIGASSGDASNNNWNITMANIGGSILMLFAAVSFFAASIAFAVRIGVLILLMAFSPVYFIAMIFPDLQKYSKKWSGMLYSMCIFMPVYLFLMYVAMSVINDPHFFCFAQTIASPACPQTGAANTNLTGGLIGGIVGSHTIGIVLQYIIAILLINAPLFAAISIAGEGADFVSDLMKKTSKWGQGAIQGGHAFVAQHTAGRAARGIADSAGFKSFAKNNPLLGTYAARGLKGVAGASYGGTKGGFDARTKNYVKTHEEVAKSLELEDDQLTRAHYNQYDSKLRKAISAANQKRDAIYSRFDNPNLSAEEEARIQAEALEAQKKVDELKGKLAAPDDQKKDDVKKIFQEEYAKNLEKGDNPVTRKARKEAARKILKGLTKNKKDKLFDELKDMIPDDNPKDKPAEDKK